MASTEAWTSTANTMLFAQIAMASSMAQKSCKLDYDQVCNDPAHRSLSGCIDSSRRLQQCPTQVLHDKGCQQSTGRFSTKQSM